MRGRLLSTARTRRAAPSAVCVHLLHRVVKRILSWEVEVENFRGKEVERNATAAPDAADSVAAPA